MTLMWLWYCTNQIGKFRMLLISHFSILFFHGLELSIKYILATFSLKTQLPTLTLWTQRFPFWWYFYSAIPRSILLPVFALPWAVLKAGHRSVTLIAPALGFIFLYSFLPHKELRFIVYAFPLLNTAASLGYAHLWVRIKDNTNNYMHLVVPHESLIQKGFGRGRELFLWGERGQLCLGEGSSSVPYSPISLCLPTIDSSLLRYNLIYLKWIQVDTKCSECSDCVVQ